MIRQLQLVNFKSHKNTNLELGNLTVLCGPNGVGKSSAIQSILLLREAYLGNTDFNYLDLKANPINIGMAKDAIYQFAEDNTIGINLTTDHQELKYAFRAEKESDLVKTLMTKPQEISHVFEKGLLENENLFNKFCQFISAARLGPQALYQKDDVVVGINNQISVIEGRAEHFVHFLMQNRDIEVLESLRNSNIESNDLFYQTSAWEQEISEGVNVIVEDAGSLGYELKYQFKTNSNDGKTDAFKSTNVGFGLSYVMPILVAILSAPVGALIIIENPEAHIHPNGQAKIAKLICLAAQAGIQIIVETHSDHIINGILVQSKKFEETGAGVAKENVSIYHFQRDETEHVSVAHRIKIEEGGIIRYTPTGFFDQFTIDRQFLMGF